MVCRDYRGCCFAHYMDGRCRSSILGNKILCDVSECDVDSRVREKRRLSASIGDNAGG